MARLDKAVVKWTMTGPPHFDGANEHECWAQAWSHSGPECSLDEFKDVLKRRGVMVNQVRNTPPLFRLWIPGSSVGNAYSNTAHKLVEGMG